MSKHQSCFSQANNTLQSIRGGCAITLVLALFLTACVTNPSSDKAVVPDETAIVSTFAGSGVKGLADGYGSVAPFVYPLGEASEKNAARFAYPSGIAIDAAGNLYVVDRHGYATFESEFSIRKVTPKGEVSTLGSHDKWGISDFLPHIHYAHRYPSGIAIDAAGNLYLTADRLIRKVTPRGEISTFAESAYEPVSENGQENERYFSPYDGIAIDAAGNLHVVDTHYRCIRKMTQKGEVSALADSVCAYHEQVGADFSPHGIAIDAAGNLYVTDYDYHRIQKVTPDGKASTLAGGEQGFADGKGSAARFNRPYGIAVDAAGNLYVTDFLNHSIRKITPDGEVSTLAGSRKGFADGRGNVARFAYPSGIVIDAEGNLYVSDEHNHRIRKIVIQRP
ncbi:MAG: hypothetical protein LBQ75_07165 [Zoogloeaceae bacterium]|jgi:DNA-binding beta-propeller fold protein YncE|nr:hypothetical protein [Zoogloeaceae bacterium]